MAQNNSAALMVDFNKDGSGTVLSHFNVSKQKEEIREIIQQRRITTVFQPIVDLATGRVFSYEALSRVTGVSVFSGPEELFAAARSCGLTVSLERVCLASALAGARVHGLDRRLSVNLCPSVFRVTPETKEEFDGLMEDIFAVRDRVIVELTERFLISDHQYVLECSRRGLKVAIDDLGSGYAGLKMLTQIEPHMVKIDRFLVRGVHLSPKKQLLISALVDFCHRINALVVAEGIETMEELECVTACKVDLGQGFLLARPDAPPVPCAEPAIAKALAIRARPDQQWSFSNFVGKLAQFVNPVNVDESVEEVVSRFMSAPDLTAIPVVEGNWPRGIVHKARLFYRLGQRFGYDLFSRKAVSQVMENAMIFEAQTAIEDVSRRVVTRSESSACDAIIVVQNGSYLGMTSVTHILETITEQKINLAMQANPLTGLPGNNLIKLQIENRLSIKGVFAVMYFDLDNFKPFNDSFGFELGDRAIRLLGNLLRDIVLEWDPMAFLGHVGGDDFVALCRAGGVEDLCQTILSRFDREIISLHPDSMREQGCYVSLDRSGAERRFGPLSLSIAVVSTENRSFEQYAHLASVASEVKKKAKSMNGSSYCIDQRGRGQE